MFFHEKDFNEYVDPETAAFVAKLANAKLDRLALVVYGELLTDNSAHKFSTKKERTDSHVGLLIDPTLMGTEVPHAHPIKLDRVEKQDIESMQAKRIQQLERELATKGGKQ